MADSVLAGAPFATVTLVHQAPTGGTTTDAHGNIVPETEPVEYEAMLSPKFADQMERHHGADVKVNRVVGELISPATFAAGVGVGAKLATTYNGFGCELTLTKIIPNDLIGVVFGTAFEGELRYL